MLHLKIWPGVLVNPMASSDLGSSAFNILSRLQKCFAANCEYIISADFSIFVTTPGNACRTHVNMDSTA